MSDELPAPVAASIDATNRGDLQGFLDGFSEDGVVDDWGREFAGRDAIRGWSDREYLGKQVTLEVTSARRDGDTTVIVAQVGGNGFNGPSTFTFITAGDRLSRMVIRE